MKITVATLEGAALDWAVASIEALPIDGVRHGEVIIGATPFRYVFAPSRKWEQCGPLIERKRIALLAAADGSWYAGICTDVDGGGDPVMAGQMQLADRPLVAAMRCLVAREHGAEVEIPDAVLQGAQA